MQARVKPLDEAEDTAGFRRAAGAERIITTAKTEIAKI